MVGRDPLQLRLGSISIDPVEEGADLPFPHLQVGAQERRLLLVGQLGGGEALGATTNQSALAADPQVADPLGVTSRRDQVLAALEAQRVDRGLPPLAALAPFDFEHARPRDAEPDPAKSSDERIEDVLREPARLLESRGDCQIVSYARI